MKKEYASPPPPPPFSPAGRAGGKNNTMNQKYATYLLEKNQSDYNKIAIDFAKKREWISSDIVVLERYTQKGDKVLDLGCGSGRLQEVFNRKIDYYGIDVSEELIKIARENYPGTKFLISSPLSFPFQNNFFDKIFCLSVLHHIPSKKFRKDFIKEIKRILRPGGEAIITVWDLRNNQKSNLLLFQYTLAKLIGKSKLDLKDIFYPWKNNRGEILVQRYIHVFSIKELEKLFRRAGFIIKDKGVFLRSKKGKNIFLVAQKPKKSHS